MAENVAPASPCIGTCALDRRHGFCVGCWRSRDEVTAWREMGEAGRAAVLARLAPRRVAFAFTPVRHIPK